MKMLFLAAALWAALSSTCMASPYFKIAVNSTKVGAFQRLGNPDDNIAVGFVIPAIVHDKADGYWLIPGVTWDLLDLGYAHTNEKGVSKFILGPSVNLDEPVKSFLRSLCRGLPGWQNADSHGVLKAALAPGDGNTLALGPGFALDVPSVRSREWKGSFVVALTLSHKF